MATVTASEMQKNFGKYQAQAQREPIKVTSHGRDSVVLVSVQDFDRLQALEVEKAEALIKARVAVHRQTLEKLAQK